MLPVEELRPAARATPRMNVMEPESRDLVESGVPIRSEAELEPPVMSVRDEVADEDVVLPLHDDVRTGDPRSEHMQPKAELRAAWRWLRWV